MKNWKWYFLFLIYCLSCVEQKLPLAGETEWQKSMNAKFKDASRSPLTESDLKRFSGLDFYNNDSTFVVSASLERTPDSTFFNMKTTTDRLSEERVFGIVSFEIGDTKFKLNIYQGKENMITPGYEDYLFLPFLDRTNGESTYTGGRYLDLRIPETDSITIDFNQSYNPYCVYNEKFSCPIVPRTNYLDIKVEAGMKMYEGDQ